MLFRSLETLAAATASSSLFSSRSSWSGGDQGARPPPRGLGSMAPSSSGSRLQVRPSGLSLSVSSLSLSCFNSSLSKQRTALTQRWLTRGARPPPARPRLHGDRERRHLAGDHHTLNLCIPFSSYSQKGDVWCSLLALFCFLCRSAMVC